MEMQKWECFVGALRVGTYEPRPDVKVIKFSMITVAGKGFDIQNVDGEKRRLDGVWA